MIITLILFSTCANIRTIEDTISQFEDAANNDDFDSLKDTLSEDSDDWILGDSIIQAFMDDHLSLVTPLTYSITDIQHSGLNDATVLVQGNFYVIGAVSVQFIMRRHKEVWKIRQYWDDSSGSMDMYWQELGDGVILQGG